MSGNALATAAPAVVFRFANFQLAPSRQLLLDGDKPVRIGSRALHILTALVERAGQLVAKNELIDIVWPGIFVEDANLKVQISTLRRILGDTDGRLIANVTGRGYQFAADVQRSEAFDEAPIIAAPTIGAVPALLTRVIGRAAAIDAIAAQLQEHRFVTVTGAGGIGKTTIAISVAEQLAPSHKDGVVFVELASVSDPAVAPGVIASSLGLRSAASDPLGKVAELISGKEILLVLDNCEHLVQQVAQAVETLLRNVGSLTVLATSREPLRAQGERVYRLATLRFPNTNEVTQAEEALGYSAVALFVDRARANAQTFRFENEDIGAVVEICRRLDGLPLALELAAARLQDFGVQALSKRLADRYAILTKGLRTAVPRQKTLRATLDWSFELLTQSEKQLLARLGIFGGAFTLEVAKAICAPEAPNTSALLDELSSLAEKSMLVVDTSEDPVRYYLLETTKEYALERLRGQGEHELLVGRRAVAMRDLFEAARAQWTLATAREWLREHRHWIGDVRESLEWSLGGERDIELGAALVLEASQLWIDLGLLPEFFERAASALESLAKRDVHDKQIEMRLASAIGHAIYEIGARPDLNPAMVKAFESALALAEELGDTDQEIRALVSQLLGQIGVGEYADALPLAERVRELGRRLPRNDIESLYNRAIGSTYAMLGRFEDAERHTNAALGDPAIRVRADVREGFEFDPLISTRGTQARVLWIRGFPDQALAVARETLEGALSLGHLPTYINALQTTGMTVPLWCGERDFLEGLLETYIVYGEERQLDYRKVWRFYVRLAVDSRAEGWRHQEAQQRHAAWNMTVNNYGHELLASYHSGFVLPHMLDRVRDGKSGWCAAEVVRASGEEKLCHGDFAGAQEAFEASLQLARQQGALAWELTSAMSLRRLDLARGEDGPGRDLLASVYGKYSEGFTSADLRAASALLSES